MFETVYTYGGGYVLWQILNGIAISGSGKTIMTAMCVMTGTGTGLYTLYKMFYTGNGISLVKNWFIPFIASAVIALTPSGRVVIKDSVDPYFKTATVDNLPIGLSLALGVTGTISRFLTELVDDHFFPASDTADALKYSNSGFGFGERLASAAKDVRIVDDTMRTNMKSLTLNCFISLNWVG